jgi:hypothetical protein
MSGSYVAPAGQFCAANKVQPLPRKRMGMGLLDGASGNDFGVSDRGYSPQVADKVGWLITPPKKKPKHVSVKRTKKVSPLTKIAQAWEDPETFRPAGP